MRPKPLSVAFVDFRVTASPRPGPSSASTTRMHRSLSSTMLDTTNRETVHDSVPELREEPLLDPRAPGGAGPGSCGVNVVIPGPAKKAPYGLLEVEGRAPREFTRSDIVFLQSYANLVGAAIERPGI